MPSFGSQIIMFVEDLRRGLGASLVDTRNLPRGWIVHAIPQGQHRCYESAHGWSSMDSMEDMGLGRGRALKYFQASCPFGHCSSVASRVATHISKWRGDER